MLRVAAFVLSLAAGVALGLALTFASLADQPLLAGVTSGAWTAWPGSGTAGADPYARALYAHEGRVPLPAAAGLRFLAVADDAGRPLEGRCDYTVAGPTPPARYWTLAILDRAGAPQTGAAIRSGITSWEPVRAPDGTATVTVARQVRAGNWLPNRGTGPFVLMLDVYDTPLGIGLSTGATPPPALPAVTRDACS